MNNQQDIVISHVMMHITPETVVDEDSIKMYVDVFSKLNPLSDLEKEEVIATLHAKLSIRMDKGSYVKEKDHVPWYYTAKKNNSEDFFRRYRTFLFRDAGFSANVINALDSATDEIMDLLGNPNSSSGFQRRGLVIGDVQSGKTSTYTALINKAADSGYRIIILLTGTIEKLRCQTQGRLDEGFIGLDSTAFNRDKDNISVGVGNIDPSISGWAVTSTSSDFNASTASKLNGKLSGINDPVLFVLKKNKSVLDKLEQWLRVYNANPHDKKIHLPMLLIDDEADNASVNTKSEENPATINANIRKLLKLFSRANYVGFTATPYANIFIDPDSTQSMLEDDLFPRDFIYALEAPTNYIGARSIFEENGKYSYMLKENDDCGLVLDYKHKKSDSFDIVPNSMKEAIISFFIANAIRDLRGHNNKHRSMLINISRFIDVQENIKKTVESFVREYQRQIKNYFLTGNEALNHPVFREVRTVFEKHFKIIEGLEFDWETIQKSLNDAVASIVVRTVNGGNAAKNLNYDEYEEEGLRLIAIGGYSLSRGLTLEGLCVSYFYRNSKMYDTLMQMGRWFGYREKYADICQIWMSEDAIEWYSYISMATDELRREVRRMQMENKTPKEFGLCVRSDINTLLVTARNKMKNASDYVVAMSLNGKVIETPFLHMDKNSLEFNYSITDNFIKSLFNEGYELNKDINIYSKNPQILNIRKELIIEYLETFKSHFMNVDFKPNEIANIIRSFSDDTVDFWDVAIASGTGDEVMLGNVSVKCNQRKFDFRTDTKSIQLSGSKSRLGSTNLSKCGLTNIEVRKIEDDEKQLQLKIGEEHGFSQELYFNSGLKRRPLLVIYPVMLKATSKNLETGKEMLDKKKETYLSSLIGPQIGLSIGIPRIDGRPNEYYQYKINLIKYREVLGISLDDLEEEDPMFMEATM